MRMKVKVEITEILQRIVEIEAENDSEAIERANELYFKGQIVLDADDHIDTEINLFSIKRF